MPEYGRLGSGARRAAPDHWDRTKELTSGARQTGDRDTVFVTWPGWPYCSAAVSRWSRPAQGMITSRVRLGVESRSPPWSSKFTLSVQLRVRRKSVPSEDDLQSKFEPLLYCNQLDVPCTVTGTITVYDSVESCTLPNDTWEILQYCSHIVQYCPCTILGNRKFRTWKPWRKNLFANCETLRNSCLRNLAKLANKLRKIYLRNLAKIVFSKLAKHHLRNMAKHRLGNTNCENCESWGSWVALRNHDPKSLNKTVTAARSLCRGRETMSRQTHWDATVGNSRQSPVSYHRKHRGSLSTFLPVPRAPPGCGHLTQRDCSNITRLK